MDTDWFSNMKMEDNCDTNDEDDDYEDDDEEEIRQLDAVLEEADIDICENSSDEPLKRQSHPGSSQIVSSSSYNTRASTPTEISKIDSVLALNKMYDEKLRRLEKILGFRLRECRTKLKDIQTNTSSTDKQELFRYINCGRPYFKDQANFPAPVNEDTIIVKNQMYDFSLVSSVPGWTVRDKNQFTDVMTEISLRLKKDACNEKILDLQQSLVKKPNNKDVLNEIAKLEKEMSMLNSKTPLSKLALPLDEEYDWHMLAENLNKRHTPHEYRCLWRLYFHPIINKSGWNNSEHSQLQAIAAAQNFQDWDEIAKKLNTNRTGYQCFVYYRTNINTTSIGKKWTPEEVTYLKRLVDYFKEDYYIPWGKIAGAMENRTKIQIYNKYLRIIEQRKGRFLPEEDAVILNCVETFGPNFRRIREYLAHRSIVQIRSRYNVLSKMRISTVWSVEDDKRLIQIMSNQDSKMTFSIATKFFPGRTRMNIRSRYMTVIKWLANHPNLGIEHAPRRGARRLKHGHATCDLNQAIENLKNTLNTEVQTKKVRRKISRESDECDIEDAIVATLVNEAVKEQELGNHPIENKFILPDETIVSNKQLDLTNLRKCLIYLGSKLNKVLYKQSSHYKDYPDLGNSSQDVSLFKVKSYSKKQSVVTINVKGSPDIWGNARLGQRLYVLPPHYATITGCKALMSHVSALYSSTMSLPVLSKRNNLLKQQMEMLLERFYILFLWPMLLSNEGPTDFNNTKLRKIDSYYVTENEYTFPKPTKIIVKNENSDKYHVHKSEKIDSTDSKVDSIDKIIIELHKVNNMDT